MLVSLGIVKVKLPRAQIRHVSSVNSGADGERGHAWTWLAMGNHVICKVEYVGQNIYFSLTRHLLNPKALKVNPFCYCPFKSAEVDVG